MFSLFQGPTKEDSSEPTATEPTATEPTAGEPLAAPRRFALPVTRSQGIKAGIAVVLAAVLVYGVHEGRVAARSSARTKEAAAQLQDTQAQLGALRAKLDAIAQDQQQAKANEVTTADAAMPADRTVVLSHPAIRAGRPATQHLGKPDPRWKKVQDQLAAQAKQIDAQGKQLESTRQEIASARSDLEGSIARTHEDLVVLQKKGERNYFEFDLERSKEFRPVGPVGVSLRKANIKSQYADLKLLVDDRELTKKHLNLDEPVIFYPSGERQPVELVINGISKNHIHGYISAPKYKTSEVNAAASDNNGVQQNASAQSHEKLNVPQ